MKLLTILSILIFGASDQGKVRANGFIDPRKPTTNRDTMTFGPALEVVHEFHKQMPTGVAVSTNGRIFITYPRIADSVRYSLAEIVNGKEIPYPSLSIHPKFFEIQQANITTKSFKDSIVSAQTAVLDSQDRLWVVDTGSILRGKTINGGCKLLRIDLQTNQVVDRILFSTPEVHDDSYVSDVRFDLSRGYAYMTDSGPKPGLLVVDLESRKSWRKLDNHPFTSATEKFVPVVEGVPIQPITNGVYGHMAIGADGISLNADGTRLY
ncbi:hypothetical protein K7432_008688 [Basidiobolus ranarum]|uniref:Major royal jelly protein n=1 Tax=Basidiobolus ranarum TaxID=34480 RepID=A0ABR2WRH2_9FUNG